MITLIARVKAKAGKENIVAEQLSKLAAEVKEKEPGCTMYIPHSSADNPGEFVIIEKYIDKDAFNSHMKTQYFQALAQKFGELLDGPPLMEKFTEL